VRKLLCSSLTLTAVHQPAQIVFVVVVVCEFFFLVLIKHRKYAEHFDCNNDDGNNNDESKAKSDKEGREGADSQFSKPSQMSPAAYPHVPLDGN